MTRSRRQHPRRGLFAGWQTTDPGMRLEPSPRKVAGFVNEASVLL